MTATPHTHLSPLAEVTAWASAATDEDLERNWVEVIVLAAFTLEGQWQGDLDTQEGRNISRRELCLALGAIRTRLRGRRPAVTKVEAAGPGGMPPPGKSGRHADAIRARWRIHWRKKCQAAAPNPGDSIDVRAFFTNTRTVPMVLEAAATWPEFAVIDGRLVRVAQPPQPPTVVVPERAPCKA